MPDWALPLSYWLHMLAKHLVIVGMVGIAAYQTWLLQPEINRMALQLASDSGGNRAQLELLLRQQRRSARLSLALSLVVLALTAIARTA